MSYQNYFILRGGKKVHILGVRSEIGTGKSHIWGFQDRAAHSKKNKK